LINSAVSMKGTDNASMSISPIPSNEQGWGRVQLDQTLLFTGSTRKLYVDDHRAGMAAGATTPVTYTINGVDPSVPLKVTLVWTDYPGMPDSPPAGARLDAPETWNAAQLVNDLDLTVSGPGGMYLGNAFSEGVSTTGGSADRRNNVEQVLLAAPASGTYTLTVQPNAIKEGPQDFAIVVTGAWANVGGTVPPAGDASSPEGGGGSGGSGGTGTGGSSAGTGGEAPPPPSEESCSCSIGRKAPLSATAFLALAAAPLALLRSHRRLRRRNDGRA